MVLDRAYGPLVTAGANFEGTATRIYTYRALVDGRVLRSGRLRVVSHDDGNRVIWQGTDDFVNVCINEGETLWSKGGKLYCVSAQGTSMHMTLLS